MAFALHNIIKLTRDPHISKFQILSPNSKKKDYTFLYPLSFKKKNHKNKKNISYVHPIERVDEVGETKTGNDYRGLVGEGGSEVGHFYTVRRPQSILGGSSELLLYEAATADSPP